MRRWMLLVLACAGFAGTGLARAGLVRAGPVEAGPVGAVVNARVPETPRFRLLGVGDGLPSGKVNAFARDRDGYLWIATADGLARHDGVAFRVWRHEPGDPGALPGNNVQALHIDAEDRVWVATEFGGLSVLDRPRTRFRHYRKATHPRIGSDDTWAIAGTRDGALWFGTADGGLHRLGRDGTIRRWTTADGLPADAIVALAAGDDGTLWIGTTGGLARWRGGPIERTGLPGAKDPVVYSLVRDGDALWVGTTAGVYRLRDGRWTQPPWSPMFARGNGLLSLARDAGGLWLGSHRGLWRVGADGVPTPARTGEPDLRRSVWSLLRLPDGGLWVPVPGLGIGHLRSDWRRVAQFSRSDGSLAAESYSAVAVARDGGAWIAGDGAVERLHASGAVSRLDEGIRARLRGIRLKSVAEDAAGRLWLGHNSGLLRIGGAVVDQPVVDEWKVDDLQAPIPASPVDLLWFAPDGTLWLSANGGGVQQRDPDNGAVLAEVRAGSGGIGAGDTEALEFDAGGVPWIAHGGGLSRWDARARAFVPVAATAGRRVHAFAFDGANELWLHRTTGLERYRRHGGRWSRVATPSPASLPAIESAAMRIDHAHKVWLSTRRGLFRFDPVDAAVRRFGVQHGLASQEFADRALALTGDGVLVGPTSDGSVVMVDTAAADPPQTRPRLRIDAFAVRRDGRWQALPLAGRIQLAPADHELQVAARLLAYDDPSAHRYWTRLEGFDRDWIAQGASGERSFAGLDPGRYTWRVRARDAAGRLATTQAVAFRILPPCGAAAGPAPRCWPPAPCWCGGCRAPTTRASTATTRSGLPSRNACWPNRPRRRSRTSSPTSATRCARR